MKNIILTIYVMRGKKVIEIWTKTVKPGASWGITISMSKEMLDRRIRFPKNELVNIGRLLPVKALTKRSMENFRYFHVSEWECRSRLARQGWVKLCTFPEEVSSTEDATEALSAAEVIPEDALASAASNTPATEPPSETLTQSQAGLKDAPASKDADPPPAEPVTEPRKYDFKTDRSVSILLESPRPVKILRLPYIEPSETADSLESDGHDSEQEEGLPPPEAGYYGELRTSRRRRRRRRRKSLPPAKTYTRLKKRPGAPPERERSLEFVRADDQITLVLGLYSDSGLAQKWKKTVDLSEDWGVSLHGWGDFWSDPKGEKPLQDQPSVIGDTPLMDIMLADGKYFPAIIRRVFKRSIVFRSSLGRIQGREAELSAMGWEKLEVRSGAKDVVMIPVLA